MVNPLRESMQKWKKLAYEERKIVINLNVILSLEEK